MSFFFPAAIVFSTSIYKVARLLVKVAFQVGLSLNRSETKKSLLETRLTQYYYDLSKLQQKGFQISKPQCYYPNEPKFSDR